MPYSHQLSLFLLFHYIEFTCIRVKNAHWKQYWSQYMFSFFFSNKNLITFFSEFITQKTVNCNFIRLYANGLLNDTYCTCIGTCSTSYYFKFTELFNQTNTPALFKWWSTVMTKGLQEPLASLNKWNMLWIGRKMQMILTKHYYLPVSLMNWKNIEYMQTKSKYLWVHGYWWCMSVVVGGEWLCVSTDAP